jgi:hypothetical protein
MAAWAAADVAILARTAGCDSVVCGSSMSSRNLRISLKINVIRRYRYARPDPSFAADGVHAEVGEHGWEGAAS